MTLEIVSGGAGSGKTRLCMDLLSQAVSEGRSRELFFLLYNNAQVQTVREYLRGELDAYIEPELLTFNGLIREILSRSLSPPPGIAPPNVAMHLFREAAEEAKPSYYRGAIIHDGLLALLKDVVDELKTNGVSPDDLQEGALRRPGRGSSADLFAKKTGEVVGIYRRYQELLQEHGYEEWPDAAYRAVQSLREAPDLLKEKSLLLMDGFFYLTPWQKEILQILIERVPRSVVTICYEEGREGVFGCLGEMHDFLKDFSGHIERRLTENRRAEGPLLTHIERHLFRPGAPAVPADESISIYEAGGRDMEVEMIARSIKRMVIEQDYRYTDFGILLRSDADYKHIFRQVFGRYEIPLVTSRSFPLKDIPGVRAVITLLRMVTDGWRRDRVISLLRDAPLRVNGTEGAYLTARVVDYMENRALAKGIDDRQGWLREFPPAPESGGHGRRELELESSKTVEKLLGLEERLAGPHTVRSLVSSLTEIMDELGILENAFAQGVNSPASGDLPVHPSGEPDVRMEAAAVEKLYELMGQFLRLAERNGDKNMEVMELLKFVALSAETESLDHTDGAPSGVWLSNIFESRVPEFRVVFIAGLLEGTFPPGFAEDPIFRDSERRLLNRPGRLVLQEKRTHADREKYLFYIAATRASEKMVLTYPVSDASGKEKLASFYVEELRKLFTPETREGRVFRMDYSHILPPPDEILNESELLKCIIRGLTEERAQEGGDGDAGIASLYNLALDRAPGDLKEALTAVNERGKPALSPARMRRLTQEEKPFTVSQIHTFGVCKFKYYCKYHLRLKPREEKRLEITMEGEIFHEALRRIYLRAREEGAVAYPRDAETFVEEGLRELEGVMKEGYAALLSSARGKNLRDRMAIAFRTFLEEEFAYQSRSAARPSYLELSFGTEDIAPQQDPRSVEEPLPLGWGKGREARLRGRMDRVDLLQDEDRTLGIILDYKRGRVSITRDKMLDGDDIRLPLYMLALKRLFGVEPAGGLYYSIRDSVKRGVYLSKIAEGMTDEGWGLSKKDAADHTEMAELLSSAEETALERIRLIREGEIAAKPLSDDECNLCDYDFVCRYERGMRRPRDFEED